MIYEVKGTEAVARLFGDWPETLIWSCLQGVMGRLYADAPDMPTCAMALLGDFAFLAGAPNRELAAFKPAGWKKDFVILVANDPAWYDLVREVYGERAREGTRYAIRKEGDVFDRKKLKAFTEAIGPEYRLAMIDEALYAVCAREDWSDDFVSQYGDYETFRRLGLGVVALHEGKPVAGASSYSRYRQGIEIEIVTKDGYRRQGLATACGARLILECLERGLYPSWDAQNTNSVALAQKLGYHFDHPYTIYEIHGWQRTEEEN